MTRWPDSSRLYSLGTYYLSCITYKVKRHKNIKFHFSSLSVDTAWSSRGLFSSLLCILRNTVSSPWLYSVFVPTVLIRRLLCTLYIIFSLRRIRVEILPQLLWEKYCTKTKNIGLSMVRVLCKKLYTALIYVGTTYSSYTHVPSLPQNYASLRTKNRDTVLE